MSTREEIMDEALPRLAERFKKVLDKGPAWRSLFEVFGADEEDPARQRVRVVGVKSKSLPRPPGLPGEANVSHLTGAVAGSMIIRTSLALSREDVTVAGSDDSGIDPKLDELYSNSGRAASAALFDATKPQFKVDKRITTKLDNLAERLPEARRSLPVRVVDLLVSEERSVGIVGDMRKAIETALNGGAVVPVAGIADDDEAYVVPHQSGEIRIETVRAPAVSWEPGANGSADVMVSEEFIVVPRAKVPVWKVTLLARSERRRGSPLAGRR